MKNAQQKNTALWWRLQFLEITKISLNLYKKSNDKKFYEFGKYFGEESKNMGEEYQRLSIGSN
jgi:hypothetical protein